MILFPHGKINLGLHITARRSDGYHDIETLFVSVPGLCDAVELLRDPASATADATFSSTGLAIDCPAEKNLCVKAYRLLRDAFPDRFRDMGGVRIHLHKAIPFGAGLGGGSADATAILQAVNDTFELGLTMDQLAPFAARLGSDTVFFLYDQPMLGTGRGERLEPFPGFSLTGWWLLLVKPEVGVSTAEAYSLITPKQPAELLVDILRLPVDQWRGRLVNDFEEPLFRRLPVLAGIKDTLYETGAIYAAISGSGSTVFGLFRSDPSAVVADFGPHYTHIERL